MSLNVPNVSVVEIQVARLPHLGKYLQFGTDFFHDWCQCPTHCMYIGSISAIDWRESV
jgi:hypothetical protein